MEFDAGDYIEFNGKQYLVYEALNGSGELWIDGWNGLDCVMVNPQRGQCILKKVPMNKLPDEYFYEKVE